MKSTIRIQTRKNPLMDKMNSDFSQCSLYLHPDTPSVSIDNKKLGLLLNKLSLTGQAIPGSDREYYAGDRFLELVSFMGCSPAIQLEAGESKSFCFIRLHHYDNATLITSEKQFRAPQCPQCNKPIPGWNNSDTPNASCGNCLTTSSYEQLNWRKMAGYANYFIEITDIFPKEAIPQSSLLETIQQSTGTEWKYFYSCAE